MTAGAGMTAEGCGRGGGVAWLSWGAERQMFLSLCIPEPAQKRISRLSWAAPTEVEMGAHCDGIDSLLTADNRFADFMADYLVR